LNGMVGMMREMLQQAMEKEKSERAR
jgi:hypothetical protein